MARDSKRTDLEKFIGNIRLRAKAETAHYDKWLSRYVVFAQLLEHFVTGNSGNLHYV